MITEVNHLRKVTGLLVRDQEPSTTVSINQSKRLSTMEAIAEETKKKLLRLILVMKM